MDGNRQIEIDAILGEEFNKLLENLEIKAGFEGGQYRCVICGEVITYNNVLLVFPMSDTKVGFVCKKPECFVSYKREKEASA